MMMQRIYVFLARKGENLSLRLVAPCPKKVDIPKMDSFV